MLDGIVPGNLGGDPGYLSSMRHATEDISAASGVHCISNNY